MVLGMCAGRHGFPSEALDDPLLDLVLPTRDAHPDAEERRLLYVAITRARRQVYLLANGGRPSSFVRELIDGDYDVAVFGKTPDAAVPCRRCRTGRLERRENPRDSSTLHGCTNYPLCTYVLRPCPTCNTDLPMKTGDTRRCNDCGRCLETCPAMRQLACHPDRKERAVPGLFDVAGVHVHAKLKPIGNAPVIAEIAQHP